MNTYIVIPEHVVEDAAAAIPDDEENSFARLLKTANEFREAGLTPLFLVNEEFKNLVVICKETYGKKLH
jgi:hypothetical protein